jgi:ectoine hydroxylase-related dioxygenase (phytanoyl-CoA dioxygenase family)
MQIAEAATAQTLKRLSPDQVAQYRTEGFLAPIRVMPASEARNLRTRLEAFEAREGAPLHGALRHKTHLLFPWLNDLIRHPAILDVVEDVLGPNLLCWSSSFFIKEAHDAAYVSWHQDSTYWGLSEPEVMTAWVAFTVSNPANGCMRVVPRSHLRDQVPHRDTFAAKNILTRGQEIAVEVQEDQAVNIVLEPGEISLHHVRLFHSSDPNNSDDRRIGYAIRYIPTWIRQIVGERDSATLVAGRDDYGHFDLEPRPAYDLAPEAVAAHAEICRRNAQVLYRGTDKRSF